MSIWTKPIFGKPRIGTPLGDVGIRCARMRAAGFESVFGISVGYLLGAYLFLGELVLVFVPMWSSGTLTPAQAILPFLKHLNWHDIVVPLVLIGLMLWALPPVARWLFDKRASRLTREAQIKLRKARKQVRWFWGGMGLLLGTSVVAVCLLGRWQVGLLLMAKYAASVGGAIIGFSLRGRRGVRLVCAHCDYPMVTWRGAAPRCPECGRHWHKPWGARLGERTVLWGWTWTGAGLLLLSLLLVAIVGARGL